jgi:hypothetical protein
VTRRIEPEEPSTIPEGARGSFVNDVAPALVWTIIVFVFGGIPNPGPPVPLDFPIDKLEHVGAFAVLQILVLRALRYELPGTLPRAMPWIAALISIVVGGALELYQLTVPLAALFSTAVARRRRSIPT